MTRRHRWSAAVAAAFAVPVLALTGCSSHDSQAPSGSAPAASPSAGGSGTDSGTVQHMRDKVDAAQSAADAADQDAAHD